VEQVDMCRTAGAQASLKQCTGIDLWLAASWQVHSGEGSLRSINGTCCGAAWCRLWQTGYTIGFLLMENLPWTRWVAKAMWLGHRMTWGYVIGTLPCSVIRPVAWSLAHT